LPSRITTDGSMQPAAPLLITEFDTARAIASTPLQTKPNHLRQPHSFIGLRPPTCKRGFHYS
jgi:hypothetical protein